MRLASNLSGVPDVAAETAAGTAVSAGDRLSVAAGDTARGGGLLIVHVAAGVRAGFELAAGVGPARVSVADADTDRGGGKVAVAAGATTGQAVWNAPLQCGHRTGLPRAASAT